jgi:diguanylate cyclase (GGDEF)-like protein
MDDDSCELVLTIGTHEELVNKLKTSKMVNCFLLNIDNFSNINNAYGYEVGNEVLCWVTRYLNISKPNFATLYRLYSDRFVLIDEQKLEKRELIKTAEAILSFFSQTEFLINGDIELKVSLSIGISTGTGLVNILHAEMAIKELRESKRNHYNIFNPDSKFIKNEYMNIYWILKINEAVANEDIVAYFQPIVNNHTGKIEKYECLARLRDDDKIISPYCFMNAAKVTGNLSYVTKSLIAQSFKKFSGTDYEFSINITSADFSSDYLELFLLKNVHKYDINPSRVVLEMLEDITTLDSGTIMQ